MTNWVKRRVLKSKLKLFRTLDSPPVLGAVVAAYQMAIIFLIPFLLMSSSYYKVYSMRIWKVQFNNASVDFNVSSFLLLLDILVAQVGVIIQNNAHR